MSVVSSFRDSNPELEDKIQATVLSMRHATTTHGRRTAHDSLMSLRAQRSPALVAELDAERLARVKGDTNG